MYKFIASAAIAIGCFWSLQASAAISLTEWGVTARTDSADCTGGITGDCTSFATITLEDGESIGGSNDTSATIGSASAGSTVNLQGRGAAGAEAVIPGSGFGVPVLRARAESTDGDGWVAGSALAIQGYQFTGADSTPISLDVSLSGTVSPGASLVTGLEVNIWILNNTDLFSFPAESASVGDIVAGIWINSFQECLCLDDPFIATLTWEMQGAEGNGTGAINRSTTTTDPDDQLNFTLDNGDEFYLFAALAAGADGVGASALSWSTLTMEFDTPDLAAASVPVPPAVWLLGSGLFGLIGLRGRAIRRESAL